MDTSPSAGGQLLDGHTVHLVRCHAPTSLDSAGRGVVLIVDLAGFLEVLPLRHCEVVIVGEDVARVIRRVDVDQLDCT